MLVAHACDGCSSAPLTQDKNNPIYQDITEEGEFTGNERVTRVRRSYRNLMLKRRFKYKKRKKLRKKKYTEKGKDFGD